jgi:N-acetyl-alpha-D-glucosaminyl L-malate synthase BshA
MHVHYAIPHATTAWLAKQMLADERDLKVLTTLHGTDITLVGQDPSYFSITKFSIERSDAVTAVSAFLRDETYKSFGCVNCDLRVIPNFISLSEYHPATDDRGRRALAPAGNKVLVHISNFRPVKRVLDVVRIFAGVRKVLPATLIMAGDGPDRDAAEAEVDRLKLTRDVRFLGRVEDVADVLRGADLFLLPTQSESFGLAALEAMACGVPVIAARAGGIPEVVVDGETGVLAEPGAVDAMVDAALSILKDPKRQQRMGAAAVARAGDFTTDKIVPQYEALYRELLGA